MDIITWNIYISIKAIVFWNVPDASKTMMAI
jgi:hypothetical protein